MLIPVILSGGAGVRLWPESRELRPKPLLRLEPAGESLLLKTVNRALRVSDSGKLIVVTNQDHLYQSLDEIGRVAGEAEFLLEGCGRNTAPAILLAARHVQKIYGDDAVMLVLAADHEIRNQEKFAEAVRRAGEQAAQGKIVTFGIKPSRPECGYGYLKTGKVSADSVFEVEKFVEKPNAATAKEYVDSGNYFWNSGMFCFRVGTILATAESVAPELAAAVNSVYPKGRRGTGNLCASLSFGKDAMAELPAISIDYAVMEKAAGVVAVACDIGWSDVGAWDAVKEVAANKDASGNVIQGNAIVVGSENCLVRTAERLVAVVGGSDLMVVDSEDALLVVGKSAAAQDVKAVVSSLKKDNPELCVSPRTVRRPWGGYTVLAEGPHYKVKRIEVKTGGRLSLQKHAHRSEHWVVVSGTARVVNGEKTVELHANESTYIPVGNVHRLENVGMIPLVIIEVQSGEYLGEDDIVRLEDIYDRG